MELADLSRDEWWAMLRALATRVTEDRAYYETQGWVRRNQGLFEAGLLQDLHDRLAAEYKARALRGEVENRQVEYVPPPPKAGI